MKCRQYSELLTAFTDQEIGAADLIRLHGHLRECPSCKRRIESLKFVQEAFREEILRLGPLTPSPGFARRIAAEVVPSEGGGRVPGSARRGFRFLAACASLAAAAVLLFFLWFLGKTQTPALLPVYDIQAQEAQMPSTMDSMVSEYVNEHVLVTSENPLSTSPGLFAQVSTRE